MNMMSKNPNICMMSKYSNNTETVTLENVDSSMPLSTLESIKKNYES